MDNDDRQHVKELIETHAEGRRLSAAQKWDVAVIVIGIVFGIATFLSIAGGVLVSSIARERAEEMVKTAFLQELSQDKQFISALSDVTISTPESAVIAFASLDGCPAGWEIYSEAQGRLIVGVNAPEASATNNLSLREYYKTYGSETISLQLAHLPPHDHTTVIAHRKLYEDPKTALTYLHGEQVQGLDTATLGRASDLGVKTSSEGEGQALQVMPPTIALHFCQRKNQTP